MSGPLGAATRTAVDCIPTTSDDRPTAAESDQTFGRTRRRRGTERTERESAVEGVEHAEKPGRETADHHGKNQIGLGMAPRKERLWQEQHQVVEN